MGECVRPVSLLARDSAAGNTPRACKAVSQGISP